MDTPVIEMRDVWYSYNGHPVLEKVNLEIPEHDFVAVIGPNGGGKTTLLKLMLGLLKPTRGSVRVFGVPAESASRFLGYVPQNVHINSDFPVTAMDVVMMGNLDPKKRWKKSGQDRRDALEALGRMDMANHAQTRIGNLSGGQRQRVLIARALVTHPKLLLLDEPTASIDSKGQNEFYCHLKELNRDVTILVVSHDIMVVSRFTKSVACVNTSVHYHDEKEITDEMLGSMYPGAEGEACPVELIAHGLPHRVLQHHEE